MDENHSSTPMTNLTVISPIDEADEPVCTTADRNQDMGKDPDYPLDKSPPSRSSTGITLTGSVPDALSRFRKATRQVIAARRFSSKHAAIINAK